MWSPPYDVIDEEQRASSRTARPTTWSRSTSRETPTAAIPTSTPRGCCDVEAARACSSRRRARDLGARAGLQGARRRAAHPAGLPRPGPAGALRRGHPAPRAHPAGPEGGPPAPHPGDQAQPLPDLLAPPRRRLAAHRARARRGPVGEVTDADGTTHRVWRVGDPAVHEAIAAELADRELLIADGHHRYETALAYQREVGGEGRPRLHADGAGLARGPRAHRLPHPPPAEGPRPTRARAGSADSGDGALRARGVEDEELVPGPEDPVGPSATWTPTT